MPCIVLLHGWPQTSYAWEQVLDELGRDQYALAFDLPGVGGSQGSPQPAEKQVLADIVLTAAEQIGAKNILVAGYDVGGMVAFACARDHPARIEGAVVMKKTPAEFGAFMESEMKKWEQVVKKGNIKAE